MPNEITKKTIVLKSERDRETTLKAIAERGGRVVHDSGQRVLVIEVPKRTRLKDKLLPTTKIVKINGNVKRAISRPSKHETLFIDALKLRTSRKFINEKMQREPGSTPEEQKMFETSDFLGDDLNTL